MFITGAEPTDMRASMDGAPKAESIETKGCDASWPVDLETEERKGSSFTWKEFPSNRRLSSLFVIISAQFDKRVYPSRSTTKTCRENGLRELPRKIAVALENLGVIDFAQVALLPLLPFLSLRHNLILLFCLLTQLRVEPQL